MHFKANKKSTLMNAIQMFIQFLCKYGQFIRMRRCVTTNGRYRTKSFTSQIKAHLRNTWRMHLRPHISYVYCSHLICTRSANWHLRRKPYCIKQKKWRRNTAPLNTETVFCILHSIFRTKTIVVQALMWIWSDNSSKLAKMYKCQNWMRLVLEFINTCCCAAFWHCTLIIIFPFCRSTNASIHSKLWAFLLAC